MAKVENLKKTGTEVQAGLQVTLYKATFRDGFNRFDITLRRPKGFGPRSTAVTRPAGSVQTRDRMWGTDTLPMDETSVTTLTPRGAARRGGSRLRNNLRAS